MTYTVPTLVGKLYEDVKDDTDLLGEHFTVVLGDTVADDAEPGTVLKQDPEEGKKVTGEMTEIVITISGGQEMIEMIDLTNMDLPELPTTLWWKWPKAPYPLSMNYDDEVEENHVISYTL